MPSTKAKNIKWGRECRENTVDASIDSDVLLEEYLAATTLRRRVQSRALGDHHSGEFLRNSRVDTDCVLQDFKC